jgi:hypothetical protein
MRREGQFDFAALDERRDPGVETAGLLLKTV